VWVFLCWPVCADVVAMPPRARKWWRAHCRCNIPAERGFPAGATSPRDRSHDHLTLPPSPYYHCDVDWAFSIFSPVETQQGKTRGKASKQLIIQCSGFPTIWCQWSPNWMKKNTLPRNPLLKIYIFMYYVWFCQMRHDPGPTYLVDPWKTFLIP